MKKPFDDICVFCENREISCITPCAPLKWINGNTPSKEVLLSELKNKPPEYVDYNITLAELINNNEPTFDKVINIPNIRQRAIAAMILVHISRNDIANLLSMSYRQLLRIINNTK